ncbi:hypothetical protein J6590_002974 [Homalodisca vitripennis]|nr:hypothetical protein J6590_002974 [Homalodisca vitripennis]
MAPVTIQIAQNLSWHLALPLPHRPSARPRRICAQSPEAVLAPRASTTSPTSRPTSPPLRSKDTLATSTRHGAGNYPDSPEPVPARRVISGKRLCMRSFPSCSIAPPLALVLFGYSFDRSFFSCFKTRRVPLNRKKLLTTVQILRRSSLPSSDDPQCRPQTILSLWLWFTLKSRRSSVLTDDLDAENGAKQICTSEALEIIQ